MKEINPKMKAWNESRKFDCDRKEFLDLWIQGNTAIELAVAYGVSTSPIKRILKEMGLKRPANRRTGMAVGNKNPAWKGGRRIRVDGYVVIWTKNGERLEHQVVMETALGRYLRDGEVVHHKDGDKQNNKIENLELTKQSDHIRHHLLEMHKARYKK